MEKYLEDWSVGEIIETKGRTIGEGDVSLFAGLTGDFHRNHTDAEYMAKSQFKQRIAHGLFGLAVSHGLMSQCNILNEIIAFLEVNEWKFQKPIFFGDTVHVRLTVKDVRPSRSKPDRGVLNLYVELINQNGEVTQSGYQILMCKRKTTN